MKLGGFLTALVIVVACVALWIGHFRYAGWQSVETDRWVGVTERQAVDRLGEPSKRYEKYLSIGFAANTRNATRSWSYSTLFGTLYLHFRDGRCVESIYFSDRVQF